MFLTRGVKAEDLRKVLHPKHFAGGGVLTEKLKRKLVKTGQIPEKQAHSTTGQGTNSIAGEKRKRKRKRKSKKSNVSDDG